MVSSRMRQKTIPNFLLMASLCLPLVGCQDTKMRQENERLKAQVLELQKESGDLGNRIETLTKENAAVKDENERLKARRQTAKSRRRKHRRSTSKPASSSQD